MSSEVIKSKLRVSSFSPDKLPKKIDVIVIGSGMGGLTAAAHLARVGKTVVLLEQHYTLGGCTHTFRRRNGVEHDTGLHYVGADMLNPKSGMRRLLDGITNKSIEWADLGKAYDIIYFADTGEKFPIRAGKENFRSDLIARFPKERSAIDCYFQEVAAAQKYAARFFVGRMLPNWLGTRLGKAYHTYINRTTGEVLETITSDPHLRAILGYVWGDLGLPPSRSSFAAHAMVVDHYLGGACFPVGGPGELAYQIVPFILKHSGSQVFIRARAERIVTEKGAVTGVMVKGHFIPCSKVISAAGAHNTERLLAASLGPLPAPSESHLCLFITFEGNFQPSTANHWIFPSGDHDQNFERFRQAVASHEEDLPFPGVFISFPSAKNPCHNFSGNRMHTCQVLTQIPYDVFKNENSTRVGHRSLDYKSLKARLTERLLGILKQYFPDVHGAITTCELGTPLSSEHFIASARGASYGTECSPGRFHTSACATFTPVTGLYQGGQDGLSFGVVGAMMGGFFAALAASPGKILAKNGLALTRV